jgi:sigma-B regulation protein RsbU (phosphoserine phosphatase)
MAIMHAIAHQFPGPASPPGQLLAHVNRELCSRYTNDPVMFVTAFYGVFDPRTRTLTYANAGHPSPVVRNFHSGASGAIASTDSSIPLGITSDVSFIDSTHQLTSGDVLVLYTDGIIESESSGGDEYGIERLCEVLVEHHALSAQDLVNSVMADLHRFSGEAPQSDDITLIAIKKR